jgi:hypothetical protein
VRAPDVPRADGQLALTIAASENRGVRWNAGYVPEDDDAPEVAGVEATSAIDAVARLRDVVGADADVLFVIPDPMTAEQDDADTYEAFLQDPDAAS